MASVFYTKKAKAEMRKRRRKMELQKAGGDGDDVGGGHREHEPTTFADGGDLGNAPGMHGGGCRKRAADQTSDGRMREHGFRDGPSSSDARDDGSGKKTKVEQPVMTVVIPRDLPPKDAKKFRKDARRRARLEGQSEDRIQFVVEGQTQKEGGPSSSSSSSSSSTEPSPSAGEGGKEGDGHHARRKDKAKDKKSFPRINDLLAQHAAKLKLQEKLAKQRSINDSLSSAEKRRYVAMDCEMVGTGPEGKRSALARVSVVDWDGKVLLDTFVRVPERVTDFRTRVSGVRPRDIAVANVNAMGHDEVRAAVGEMLSGKVLVGHALRNDLSALMLSHPRGEIRDTARYAPFMRPSGSGGGKLRPRKLRDLVYENLGRRIQVEGESHCSIDDARGAMELFQIVRGRWEKDLEQSKKGGGGIRRGKK